MPPQSDAVSRAASRAAFGYSAFRRYMAARIFTTSASEMQSVAVGWQIYEITHQPRDLGLVGLAQFLPGICLFLLAGHTADRVPRHKIIRTCYAGFTLCSLLLLLLSLRGLASPYPIYAILLMNGVVRAFNAPASQAILPLLVSTEHFPNAVAWNSSIFQSATIAGPMIGGILYGATGRPQIVYLTAAISYALAFFVFRTIELQPTENRGASAGMVLEGIRYIWRNKLLFGAISLDLFAVLLGGAVALLPVYAQQVLHTGPWGLGVLRGAPGVGAVLMAVAIAHWPLRRQAGVVMLFCVFGFGACTVAFGLSNSLLFSVIMLILIGATDMISVIVRTTMVQLATPDQMRGRVSAVNMVFIGASNEVGEFESGITAQWLGAVPAVVIGGIGTMLIVALWSVLFPALRKVDRLVPEDLPKLAAETISETSIH